MYMYVFIVNAITTSPEKNCQIKQSLACVKQTRTLLMNDFILLRLGWFLCVCFCCKQIDTGERNCVALTHNCQHKSYSNYRSLQRVDSIMHEHVDRYSSDLRNKYM